MEECPQVRVNNNHHHKMTFFSPSDELTVVRKGTGKQIILNVLISAETERNLDEGLVEGSIVLSRAAGESITGDQR